MCIFKQSGKHKVKDMNVYIEPFVDELRKLWDDITVYSISRPIWKVHVQFDEYLLEQFMIPRANTILWYVAYYCTSIVYNFMKISSMFLK
jgi:hypothetical protein